MIRPRSRSRQALSFPPADPGRVSGSGGREKAPQPPRKRRAVFAAVATVTVGIALAGCWDDPVQPVRQEGGLLGASPEAILASSHPRGIEDDFLRMEIQLPGFGGLYLDQEQNIVAYVTDLSRASNAAALIAQVFLDGPRPRGRFTRPDGSRPTIRIVRGDYSMSQLIEWQQAMWRGAESHHRIWLADADEGRNRVRLGIGSREAISAIEALARANGVPVEALYFQEMRSLPVLGLDLRDEVRPTVGGVQISRSFQGNPPCSMGFNVRDSGDDRYFLTASHCGGQFTGNMQGLSFYQPGDGSFVDPVGATEHNPAWSTSACYGGASYCRDTDAATVKYGSGVAHSFRVAETTSIGTGWNPGNTTIGATRRVVDVAAPMQGMILYKTGRSSGTTTTSPDSLASGTCSAGLFHLPSGADSIAVNCAFQAPYYAEGGDSGAPVYRVVASHVEAVGIHFAANSAETTSFFTAWADIESELGVALNPIAPLTVAIGGPTEVREDDPCAWNSAVGGGRPPYTFNWSGVLSGSGPAVFGSISSSGSLNLEVESDDGQIDGDTIFIEVSPSAPDCVESPAPPRGDR